ncbi:metallophosphoesterase family protein [Niameybacter massiliensis]|uniref:Phosphoesterase n=1 Tax=Holtiella tumoricola TaxID=3018743 RepID=A0AA42J030_9FIRM|nr:MULTISPECIES: metallophosphoesterase family protein [Lachnospirales]MDA3730683.1 metallophosphoesterase family protein [Holtiella tumoricola]
MKIGIISDTHGILKEEVIHTLSTCDYIFHAGDVGDQEILRQLESIATTYAIQGNNDSDSLGLKERLEIEIAGYQFYMVHDLKSEKILPKGYDFVISGHSHQFDLHYSSKTTWINPGGCGKRRFGLPLTMVRLHLEEQVHIELLTLSK